MNDIVDDNALERRRMEPPASLLVPRGGDDVAASIAAGRDFDRNRVWTTALKYLSGWFVAALLVIPLTQSLAILKNRPMPKDQIWVAVQHEDGSTSPAKPIADQTPSERENTIMQFMYDYTDYRMSYDFAHIQRNYDRTRFTTSGVAQAEFIKFMRDDPMRPTELFGANGEQRVTDEVVSRVGPDAFEVTYGVKIRTKQGIWLPEEHRRARITYGISETMPTEVARRLDPLKLVVLRFADHPAVYDPTAPGGAR